MRFNSSTLIRWGGGESNKVLFLFLVTAVCDCVVCARGKNHAAQKQKHSKFQKIWADDSSFESTLDELENLFQLATEFVRDLRDLKNEEKLKFYGLFKQVSVLKCSHFETKTMKICARLFISNYTV